MRLYLIITLSLLLVEPAVSQHHADQQLYLVKAEKFKHIRNGGIILTAVGGGLALAGMVTVFKAFSSYARFWASEPEPINGTLLATGFIGLGAGIPMCVVGTHHHRKYTRMADAYNVRLSLHTIPAGVGITIRF